MPRPKTWPARSSDGWPTSRSHAIASRRRRGWRGGAGGTSRSSPARRLFWSRRWPRFRRESSSSAASSSKTETQRREAVQQRELVIEKAESLRRRDAVSRVNLAYREYLDDNVALADELLAGCPADLREWEWEYARRLGHSELKSFSGSSQGQDVWSIAFSPDWRSTGLRFGPVGFPGRRGRRAN